jgi:hypothetical protein
MSVSSASASSNAYSYLQSLLQQGSTKSSDAGGSADPVTTLLAAFYPAGATDQSGSAAASQAPATTSPATTSPTSGTWPQPFSPDTLGTLISLQGQQSGATGSATSQAQSLFSQFDTNGDGQISKSEFETAFGPKADMSKVDGLFNALDANGDGSVSQNELTAAAKQAHGHHHHHVEGGGSPQSGGSGQSGGLADLLSATNAAGATSQSATNADGSTTTTISYADGTKISMTVPATSASASSSSGSDSQSSGNGGGSGSSGSGGSSGNVLEQLIRLQSEMIAQFASATTTTPPIG